MSSSDKITPAGGKQPDAKKAAGGALAPVLAVVTLVLLAACNVRPLYLSDPASGIASPVPELRAIVIEQPSDRVEQVLRNELQFLFRGDGGGPDASTYNLRLLTRTARNTLAVELEEDLPSAIFLNVTATFILSETGTERTLLTGTARAGASYDFSSQRFANVRAERDAETRAAKTVAEQINARIASYFAARAS